jgi:hypothetical protein
MTKGSIELARSLCNRIAGELEDGEVYGSVDVAEILSAEVLRLERDLVAADIRIGNDKMEIARLNAGWESANGLALDNALERDEAHDLIMQAIDKIILSNDALEAMTANRDEYQREADGMAAKHKVERDALAQEVDRARADERIAMSYLSEARKAMGVDCDFPSMISLISALKVKRDALADLLEKALYALEYASDITKPEGLSGCDCPICTVIGEIEAMKEAK